LLKQTERKVEEDKRRLDEAKVALQTVEAELRDFFGRFGHLAQAPVTLRRQPE